jgi:hypothetical protein
MLSQIQLQYVHPTAAINRRNSTILGLTGHPLPIFGGKICSVSLSTTSVKVPIKFIVATCKYAVLGLDALRLLEIHVSFLVSHSQIRICGDYRLTVHPHLRHHPSTALEPEDIFQCLRNTLVFGSSEEEHDRNLHSELQRIL